MNAKDFIAGIEKWETETLVDGVTEFTKLVASATLVNLVQISPRDTHRYASNHIVSVGVATEYHDYDLYDNQAIQRGDAVIDAVTTPEIFYIQNNVPYAQHVEDGRGGQQPAHHVYSLTVQDIAKDFNL